MRLALLEANVSRHDNNMACGKMPIPLNGTDTRFRTILAVHRNLGTRGYGRIGLNPLSICLLGIQVSVGGTRKSVVSRQILGVGCRVVANPGY